MSNQSSAIATQHRIKKNILDHSDDSFTQFAIQLYLY